MKLAPRDAARYFAKPDPERAGLLIHGADAMRVAIARQDVVAALLGPEGEAEMRLTRMPASDLRRDPAAAGDAMRASGFFPGPRVVLIEEATDSAAPAILAALADWRTGDAALVVTAGALNARSALRKGFEAHPSAYAAALYDDPPTREEIERRLAEAGLREVGRDASAALHALAQGLDAGDFRQTLERIALYKLGDAAPLSAEEVALLAHDPGDAGIDEVLDAVCESGMEAVGPLMARMRAQGLTAVALMIGATRHFRQLHAAASHPGGVAAGVAGLRPPLYGPRRDRLQRQAQDWGTRRLEQALAILIDTDLTLRSPAPVPDMALAERALLRLAHIGRN